MSTLSWSFLDWNRTVMVHFLPATTGPIRCAASRSSSLTRTPIPSVNIWQHVLAQSSGVSPIFSCTLNGLRFQRQSYCSRSFWSLRTLLTLCSCCHNCSSRSAFSFFTKSISSFILSVPFSISKHLESNLSYSFFQTVCQLRLSVAEYLLS